MTAAPLCYDGSGLRPPELLRVQAGPLTAWYSAGELRYVRWGEREIARRIYVAVRDRNWGTAPPLVADEDLDVRADRFRLRFTVRHQQADIDFAWLGDISGEADGAITFAMQGQARARFWRNRIGFCLLHPPREAAGAHLGAGEGGVEARMRHQHADAVGTDNAQRVRPCGVEHGLAEAV